MIYGDDKENYYIKEDIKMGIFFESSSLAGDNMMNEELKHPNELMEAFIIDELSYLPQSTLREFVEDGGVADQLVTESKLRSKNTIVKMSKKDDLSRRKIMTCMQLAKDNKDPNWDKLVKAQQKKNYHKNKIIKRWMAKADRIAKKTQQEFLHGGPKGQGVLPAKFKKFGGSERISQDD